MRYVIGFARFWWDFVVGDEWRIAAGVVTSLAAGALLVSLTDVSDTIVSILVAAGIITVAIVSITGPARRARSGT
jgi:purine-cytosine permease-like protein